MLPTLPQTRTFFLKPASRVRRLSWRIRRLGQSSTPLWKNMKRQINSASAQEDEPDLARSKLQRKPGSCETQSPIPIPRPWILERGATGL